LRQVDRVVDADGGEDILEFVDESVWGHMSVPDGDAQSERVRAGHQRPGSGLGCHIRGMYGGVMRVRVLVLVLQEASAGAGSKGSAALQVLRDVDVGLQVGGPARRGRWSWSCWGLGSASSVVRRDRIKKQEGRRVSFRWLFGMDGMAGIFDGLTRRSPVPDRSRADLRGDPQRRSLPSVRQANLGGAARDGLIAKRVRSGGLG
jgi:hypothetical protein